MNEFDQMKSLWKSQKTPQPDMETLIQKIKDLKKKRTKEVTITNIIMLCTIGIILWGALKYQFQLVSTNIGVMIIILSIIIYIVYYNRLAPHISALDQAENSKEYLNNLIRYQNKRKHIQTKALPIYFLSLGIGFILYTYEFISRMDITTAYITFGILIAWFAINAFIISPKIIKKQQKNLEQLIENTHTLIEQL